MLNLISHRLSRIIQLGEGFEEEGPEKGAFCFMFPKENPNIQIICSNGKYYENVLHYKNSLSETIVIIRPLKDFAYQNSRIMVWDSDNPNRKTIFNYFPHEQ
jgi:hypothetical protein